MTKLTLQVEKPEDLDLLLSLAKRLHIPYSQSDLEVPMIEAKEKAIEYILSYENDQPSMGDAAIWQQQERTERPLTND